MGELSATNPINMYLKLILPAALLALSLARGGGYGGSSRYISGRGGRISGGYSSGGGYSRGSSGYSSGGGHSGRSSGFRSGGRHSGRSSGYSRGGGYSGGSRGYSSVRHGHGWGK